MIFQPLWKAAFYVSAALHFSMVIPFAYNWNYHHSSTQLIHTCGLMRCQDRSLPKFWTGLVVVNPNLPIIKKFITIKSSCFGNALGEDNITGTTRMTRRKCSHYWVNPVVRKQHWDPSLNVHMTCSLYINIPHSIPTWSLGLYCSRCNISHYELENLTMVKEMLVATWLIVPRKRKRKIGTKKSNHCCFASSHYSSFLLELKVEGISST